MKPAVLKTVVPERVPGVRIPLPPPLSIPLGKINEQKLASFLAKNGQGLLPIVDLIEQCPVACDRLIDVTAEPPFRSCSELRC